MLQIKSTKDGDKEQFPAFFIQGEVDAGLLQELGGKTIPCRIFVQKTDGGEIWSNLQSESSPVSIEFAEKKYTAKLATGKLHSSTSESSASVTGTFNCVEF